MNLPSLNIYVKDTKKIEKTYTLLQRINVITSAIIAFACFIATIVIAFDDEILWIIPLLILLLTAFVFFTVFNLLEIKFGMYYDIRTMRTIAEKNINSNNSNNN